jgi:hypothetical protein
MILKPLLHNMSLKKYLVPIAFVCISLIGIFLRIYFYALDRSLWYDEVRLAYSIVNRSFSGLLQPLEYRQVAPIGFLFVQKAIVYTLGKSDYALRLLPLVAGIASIPLMYKVVKSYAKGVAPFIAFGLFSFSERLIYYSSELKQYSTDVLVALFLLIVSLRCLDNKKGGSHIILGFAGAFSLWLSHPALFILVGTGFALGLGFLRERDWPQLWRIIGVVLIWCLSFTTLYFISLRYPLSDNNVINYWQGYFMPWPPWSDMSWHYRAWIDLLRNPARLPPIILTLVIIVLGWISLLYRRWQLAMIFMVSFLTVLIVSSFRDYPFGDRLMLFSLPLIFLLLAEGIERIRLFFMRVSIWPAVFSCILFTTLFWSHPLYTAYSNVLCPKMGEDIKPVMAYMRDNRLGSDSIYIYYGAQPAFQYYSSRYGFTEKDYVVGVKSRDDLAKYIQDINKLSGQDRNWFVFSHNCPKCIVDEKLFVLLYLNKTGTRKDEFVFSESAVYLYDLSNDKLARSDSTNDSKH